MSGRLSFALVLFTLSIVLMVFRGLIEYWDFDSKVMLWLSSAILYVLAPVCYVGGFIMAIISKEADNHRLKNDNYLR